jgi:hypothetical protein
MMREISDDDLRRTLAAACDEARAQDFQAAVSVGTPLRAAAGDDDDPIRGLIAGLEYHLVIDRSARRDHGAFGPMMEGPSGTYPAPLERMPPEAFELWSRAAELASLAVVRARFADLLWEARHGSRPFEWAQRAVDEYLSVPSDGFGHLLEQSDSLQRALEIASQLNDAGRRDAAIEALVDLARRAIADDDHNPGVVLPILELFAERPKDQRPKELSALVEAAVAKFTSDAWSLESALDVKAKLVEPGDRVDLHRAQVDAFADLARRSTGIVGYAHFQHAIELAEEHGLTDRADELRREIEQIPEDALDLKVISAEVEIPRDEVDGIIDSIVGDDDLASALTRFGAYLPTGDAERNREFVRQLANDFPLQHLFSTMVIGPENSLMSRVEGEDAKEDYALIQHEVQYILFFSVLATEILERINVRYGSASVADLFTTPFIVPAVAERIDRAFELYHQGDPDGAASVLSPRLERVIRELARAAGLSITQSPNRRTGAPGGVRALGDLLARLTDRLDESTRRYVRCLLSEIKGVNLRNRIGHGLVDQASQREAALLLHAACHLRLLRPGAESPKEPPEPPSA